VISVPQWAHLDEKLFPRSQGAYAFIIECRTCGYEPDEQLVIPPGRCPKCSCFAWHRLPRPGMLGDVLLGESPEPATESVGELFSRSIRS